MFNLISKLKIWPKKWFCPFNCGSMIYIYLLVTSQPAHDVDMKSCAGWVRGHVQISSKFALKKIIPYADFEQPILV